MFFHVIRRINRGGILFKSFWHNRSLLLCSVSAAVCYIQQPSCCCLEMTTANWNSLRDSMFLLHCSFHIQCRRLVSHLRSFCLVLYIWMYSFLLLCILKWQLPSTSVFLLETRQWFSEAHSDRNCHGKQLLGLILLKDDHHTDVDVSCRLRCTNVFIRWVIVLLPPLLLWGLFSEISCSIVNFKGSFKSL